MPSTDPDLSRAVSARAIAGGLLRLKWLAAATRVELAMARHDRALRFAGKAGFNPDQPRVPSGNPDGGQWTDVGGSSGAVGRDDDTRRDSSRTGRIRLAGDIPTNDPPEIPKERPATTQVRNTLLRTAARRFGPYVWLAVEAGSWVYDHKAEISAYFDPPTSLEELQEAANHPEKGYDTHHIVERNSAGTGEGNRINAPENLVRIPQWKHWEINSFYMKPNDDYGGLPPRQYLKGKSWEERTRVGLEALRRSGVLRP